MQSGDYFVDLGGQWVHGEEGNVAYELAYPLGLLDKSDRPDYGLEQEFFDSLGNPESEDLARSVKNFFLKYFERTFSENNTYKSVGNYLEKL